MASGKDGSRYSNSMSRDLSLSISWLSFPQSWHGLKAASPKVVIGWQVQAHNPPLLVEQQSLLRRSSDKNPGIASYLASLCDCLFLDHYMWRKGWSSHLTWPNACPGGTAGRGPSHTHTTQAESGSSKQNQGVISLLSMERGALVLHRYNQLRKLCSILCGATP